MAVATASLQETFSHPENFERAAIALAEVIGECGVGANGLCQNRLSVAIMETYDSD